MMRRNRWLGGVLVAVLLAATAGCGGSKDRGKNKDDDRPRPSNAR